MAKASLQKYHALHPEDRLIWTLVAISIAVHLLCFVIDKSWFDGHRAPILDEIAIEAEIYLGDFSGADTSALPKAIEAEEAAVPEHLLPQLSKTLNVEQTAKEEDSEIEESDKQNDKVQSEKLVEKKDETLLNLPKTNDDANKIDQEDALRRLAIERLKSLDKVSKKYQAEQSSAIAKLKQQSNDLVAGGSGISGNQKNAYISRLKAHIRPCYTLPTGYHLEKADLRVGVALVVAENGSIVSSEISEPSGDKLFDELAYKAIQNCAPLPAPPKGLAGMAILSYFKP